MARIFPTSYVVTGNWAHVSLGAPLVRDLDPGRFTNWARAAVASQISAAIIIALKWHLNEQNQNWKEIRFYNLKAGVFERKKGFRFFWFGREEEEENMSLNFFTTECEQDWWGVFGLPSSNITKLQTRTLIGRMDGDEGGRVVSRTREGRKKRKFAISVSAGH